MTCQDMQHWMHGYLDGTEEERLLLVFKDLARERAVIAVYDVSTPAHLKPMIAHGIKTLVDS